MAELDQALAVLARWLERQQIPYMVIGGFAVTIWGEPRFTRDIDVTISVPPKELEFITRLICEQFTSLTADPVKFVRDTRVLPIVVESTPVDLIFAALPYEEEAIERSKRISLGVGEIQICAPEDLVLHKIVSPRLRDQEDIEGIFRYRHAELDFDYLDPRVEELADALANRSMLDWYRAAPALAALASRPHNCYDQFSMAEVKITKRAEDYSRWYTDVIAAAELADYAPVKGCMIIRPNGYAIWEKMQQALDGMFKETGHQNAYFPMFIPESFLQKEAKHVEGFAPEVAVVTHAGGGKLEEPLVVRPTSETIIWNTYRNWIQSYRDLPLLINQWANVVRWEMRTRLFLRTTEFLWQEGHTAHATYDEAEEETLKMLGVYRTFAEEYMALPVIEGRKTEREKFAGADHTYSIEAMMGDGKALQAGTSHHLGQNFAKAFEVMFQTQQGTREYVYATSWGLSTRMIGALIMAHGDDNGIIIPPKLATIQVAIIPIFRKPEERGRVMEAANRIGASFKEAGIGFKVDERDQHSPGWKFNDWEKRGVPLRIELGPKDLDNNQAVLVRRDTREKTPTSQGDLTASARTMLETIQKGLFDRALEFREKNSYVVDDYGKFNGMLESGGFLWSHWCNSAACEERVKNETKATIRCIPSNGTAEAGKCVVCGEPSDRRVIFARAY